MKRYVPLAIKAIVAVVLTAWLLKNVDTGEVARLLVQVDHTWIVVAVALHATATLLMAARLQVTFGDLLPIRLWRAIRLTLAGTLFNQILPGGIGGDAYRWLKLRDSRLAWSVIPARLLLERGFGAATLIVPGLTLLFMNPDALTRLQRDIDGVELPYRVIAAGAVTLFIALLLASRARFRSRLGEFAAAVFATPRLRAAAILVTSACQHALRIIATAAFFRSLAIEVPAEALLVGLAVALLASLIPISLGAIGIREGAFTYALALFAVPISASVTVAILNRAVTIVFGAAGALAYYAEAFDERRR